METVEAIRQNVERLPKIAVSFGIGSSRLVSQIASKLNKPRGLHTVPPGEERAFLAPLPNKWLPGIGPKASARFDAAGLVTIGQVAEAPMQILDDLVGGYAVELQQYAFGIDDRPLDIGESEAKSFGEQETFETDLTDEDHVEAVLRRMADSLMLKVRETGKTIRTMTVRARYRHMDEDQRSECLHEPTDLESDIYGRLRPLLKQAWTRREGLRLGSLKLSNIYDNWRREELPLFEKAASSETQRKMARVVNDLRRSYGHDAIMRGHDLLLKNKDA